MSAAAEATRKLESLRLRGAAAGLEALLERAQGEGMTYQVFLESLVDAEMRDRSERRLKRNLAMAHFPVPKRLGDFSFGRVKGVTKRALDELAECGWIDRHENLLFFGPPGLGKTHLAIALGHAACLAGFRVRFATAVDIVNGLSAAEKAGRFVQELKKYTCPDLLVMDELGYLPIDKHGADLLFQIISQRYERGSIVLTTNKVFKQWPTIFNNDSTLTSAILDRLLHHAETVVIEGRSHRMKDRIDP